VTLAGLASDGGLYVPRELATDSRDEIAALAGLLCRNRGAVMLPFVADAGSLTEMSCASCAAPLMAASAP
jgi:threonine synthase